MSPTARSSFSAYLDALIPVRRVQTSAGTMLATQTVLRARSVKI